METSGGKLVFIFIILPLFSFAAGLWATVVFWKQRKIEQQVVPRYWAIGRQVLCAIVMNIVLYGVTAFFMLPFLKGIGPHETYRPGPEEWQAAHIRHTLFVLVGNAAGMLGLWVRQHRIASYCLGVGGIVVAGGFVTQW